jgi:two-component system LytT family response regulator
MSVTCLIIDDQDYAANILRDYVNKDPRLKLIDVVLDSTTAEQGILDGTLKADLTFLDIQMPKISGTDLAKSIKGLTEIIFTTSYAEYGAIAYQIDAIDYLLKPIDHERFKKCIEKALLWLSAKKQYIRIPGNGKGHFLTIAIHDILYIQGAQSYVCIHTINRRYVVHMPIKQVTEKFGEQHFVRVQKSFVVNIAHIESVRGNTINLNYGKQVSIGANYRQSFLEKIKN